MQRYQYQLTILSLIVLTVSCRRYSSQEGQEKAVENPQVIAINPDDNQKPDQTPEVKIPTQDVQPAQPVSFLDNARKALKKATGGNQLSQKTAWDCRTDSSPVVLYNAEHNHLVYCHKGNWKAVPPRAFPRKLRPKKRNRSHPPQPKQTRCLRSNGCTSRPTSNTHAVRKGNFECRKSKEDNSFECRSFVPNHTAH